jgi:putative transposase
MPEVRDKRADVLPLEEQIGGMSVSEARRLKALEEENQRLKQIVGEQALDIRALKAALEKKY